jgi:YD repeat-containing protein
VDYTYYRYDLAGNRKFRQYNPTTTGAPADRDQEYIYDDLHRLTSVKEGNDSDDD